MFSSYKLTTSSGKHLEGTSHAHMVSLIIKLITSATNTDRLSIGFHRDRNRRQRDLTNNKNKKGKTRVRVMLKDVFGFAEHQGKAAQGPGYKLTLPRNSDNFVLNEANATNIAGKKIYGIKWYVPHFTLSMEQQKIISKQILSQIPTELQYVERFVFMKDVESRKFETFELGTQEGINVRIWIFVGFQQINRQHSRILNNDSFCKPPVTSAHCNIGTEKKSRFRHIIKNMMTMIFLKDMGKLTRLLEF